MGLRELTSEKHRLAEQNEFNKRMISGQLSKEDYLLYLIQQYHIFKAIETKHLPYTELDRIDKILEDIKELDGKISWPLESTHSYVEYLFTLKYSDLLAHIYLNYLALTFGGQIIKSKVPGSGKMYEFNNIKQCIGSIRYLQKDEWAEEVNKGFDFLIDIFDGLQNTTRPNGE